MPKHIPLLPPLLLALGSLAACTDNFVATADMGITPGGSQDIGLARDLIESGRIPDQEHYTAEGLFSEHDLPLSGDTCEELLCPRAAATLHQPLDGRSDRMLMQLGFGTNITMDTFEREQLDVAALVDTSCSMSGAKLNVTKDALREMVSQLDADDHMALVEFGSRARVVQGSRKMDEAGRDRMLRAIDGLQTNGSTDMESGMRKGYDQLSPADSGNHRLMVFTDAQPNTGLTDESDFVRLVRDQASAGVGTTVFGTGQDLGSELADVISKVRGGSYHFLGSDEVERLFVDEFGFLVTPIAYDLDVRVIARDGIPIDEVYGAPFDGEEIRFGASTLFLSSRSGGMGATFDVTPEEGAEFLELATLAVTYTPVGGEPITSTLDVSWEGGDFLGASDDLGVHKMGVLIDQYLAMHAASRWCDAQLEGTEAEDAATVLDDTIARLSETATEVADDALAAEATLLEQLRENLAAGSSACAPADTYAY